MNFVNNYFFISNILFFFVFFFFFFFFRTYEIPLNGGTPFDTGVDLDPSVSLKSKCYPTLSQLYCDSLVLMS